MEATADGFEKFADLASANRWQSLGLGDRIVEVGKVFLGTPYVAWTLESNPERCIVLLDAMDCVTFLESTWAIAACAPSVNERVVKAAVTKTRYRKGKVDGYFSRYHYTSDWLIGNQKEGRLMVVSEGFDGGVKWNPVTDFMSKNPSKYKANEYVKEFVKGCQAMEQNLETVRFKRIPKEQWQSALKDMHPGDFIGLCTTVDGLDFSHVGIYAGHGEFMHASSSRKKVVQQNLVEWGNSVRTCNGMVVSRAL